MTMAQATAAALEGKRAVGVLFSAHWCAPCRAFAPNLALFYNECRKKDEDSLEASFTLHCLLRRVLLPARSFPIGQLFSGSLARPLV